MCPHDMPNQMHHALHDAFDLAWLGETFGHCHHVHTAPGAPTIQTSTAWASRSGNDTDNGLAFGIAKSKP